MNAKKLFQKMVLALGRVMPGVFFLLFSRQAEANPTGMTVQSGAATASVSGSRLTVTAGNNAVLNWQSFNIGQGETTVFQQPSASSVVWNHINGSNPSQIYGSLQANGIVVLLNSSGFYFGPNSFVSAAGLVVSTANCVPPQNTGGGWEFNGPPPLASIVNYGQLQVGQSGSCYLIADQVENHGTVSAPGGNVGLAAGQTVSLSERPDGRGLSMKVTLPQGSVDNYGTLVADAGTISLNAKVVNQNGFVQANSVRDDNGVIELVASDQLNLGANSQISAQGDSSAGGSPGGMITLQSGNSFSDVSGSEISVAGGANGGNGGSVEISASDMSAINSKINGSAQAGSVGGKLLLDPDYIVLGTSGGDMVNGSGTTGTIGVNDSPGGTLYLNVGNGYNGFSDSAFMGFSQINLQAAQDITIADGTQWSLSDSTGKKSGQLTLEAGGNILFGNGTAIYDANNWSVSLYAGVSDFQNHIVQPGVGSIVIDSDVNSGYLPSYIQTTAGSINLTAGQDITLGQGYVNTTGGGSITAHALLGNIDTGGVDQGYFFQSADTPSEGSTVGSFLGGMSTLAGGSVTLVAGGNVTSLLPSSLGYYYDGSLYQTSGYIDGTAGSGAYGNQSGQSGNVTIVAGGDVTGHYLVANGTGSIYAGVLMDANGNPQTDTAGNYLIGSSGNAGENSKQNGLALSLISGGWSVNAGQNIYLTEVRNPNGVFDMYTGGAEHEFDYSPGDYVDLNAGNLVEIGSTVLPRETDDPVKVPMIFPSILDIDAGAGGVTLTGNFTFDQLILFPSPEGSLVINTTGGGSLVNTLPAISGTPQVFDLIVSDSSSSVYLSTSTFGINDHAATPIHYENSTPIDLNISGDMDLIGLFVPEAAQVNVVGDMNDCRFQGMNLSSSDVTSITVGEAAKVNMENSGILNSATDGGLTIGGDITDRGAFTSITLPTGASAPDLMDLVNAYNDAVDGNPISAEALASSFFYNSKTKVLTYQNIANVNLADLLNVLQNLTIQTGTDINGNPTTKQVSVIDATTAAALLAQYDAEGPIPTAAGGLILGGGGAFDITAANMDLGTTAGIQSEGIGLYKVSGNYPLLQYSTTGANIDINLSGDLTMYSTAIASLNGGGISIFAGGDINVGSSDFNVTAEGARGIYTTGLGNVDVVADGDINVNGSRIAAYDGGNVTVESVDGDINAGTGGGGFVTVTSYSVDPTTHQVVASFPTIPGSGILATTFPDNGKEVVGNILVETPNGTIDASSGGIVQLPLNSAKGNSDAVVEVLAGYELRDSSGNPVTAADLSAGKPVQVSAGENVDASGSGIIGENVVAETTGKFEGIIFGQHAVNLTSPQIANTTILGQTVSTEGSLGGGVTLIGTESVSTGGAAGGTILSADANGGGTSFAQGTVANAASSAASSSAAAAATAAANNTSSGTEDDAFKKKKSITLARKVSRVTVLLPGRN